MKKAMIVQPMKGKSAQEIETTRQRAKTALGAAGYKVKNTYFKQQWEGSNDAKLNLPLQFLSRALSVMSECQAVYLCKGWQDARGCRIEAEAARAYGLKIIEEKDSPCASTPETE